MISTDPIFSAAGAADPGPGNAGYVLARRNQENVEIRPFELARITMLDQPDEIARKIRKAKTDPTLCPIRLRHLRRVLKRQIFWAFTRIG